MTHFGCAPTDTSIFRSQTQALTGFHTVTGLGQNEVDRAWCQLQCSQICDTQGTTRLIPKNLPW